MAKRRNKKWPLKSVDSASHPISDPHHVPISASTRVVDTRIRDSSERATIYVPRGIKVKDLKRCSSCGGLVKMPCILCRTERSHRAKVS